MLLTYLSNFNILVNTAKSINTKQTKAVQKMNLISYSIPETKWMTT